jgi:cytoskeletal protein CcmA (bactofilin family)
MGWRSKSEGAPAASDTIENVLGRSARVNGDLRADGAFRIDGTVEGSIESASSVVIGESGTVLGDVRGRDVVVAGKVNGNITASGHLDIVSTGRIEGDIDAQSVRIETGGVFRGMSRMGEKAAEAEDDPAHAHLSAIK